MPVKQGSDFPRTKTYRQRLNSKNLGRNPWERRLRLEVTVIRGGLPRRSVAEVSTLLEPHLTRGLPRRLETPTGNGTAVQFRRMQERTLRMLVTTFKFRVARMSTLLNTGDNSGPQSFSGKRACSLRVRASVSGVHPEPFAYIESRVT